MGRYVPMSSPATNYGHLFSQVSTLGALATLGLRSMPVHMSQEWLLLMEPMDPAKTNEDGSPPCRPPTCAQHHTTPQFPSPAPTMMLMRQQQVLWCNRPPARGARRHIPRLCTASTSHHRHLGIFVQRKTPSTHRLHHTDLTFSLEPLSIRGIISTFSWNLHIFTGKNMFCWYHTIITWDMNWGWGNPVTCLYEAM